MLIRKEAFNKNSELLRGLLELNLKKRLIKTFTLSGALLESETWTMQKDDIKTGSVRIGAMEKDNKSKMDGTQNERKSVGNCKRKEENAK